MPRRRAAPRLYLDPRRKQWVIRDGASFVRTGCAESDRRGAESRLAAYLGQHHKPEGSAAPLIADVLLVYAQEHVPHTKSAQNTAYNLASLGSWWGGKRTTDVTAASCRQYTASRSSAAARRDLEVLRAALHYWHKHRRALEPLPAVVLPQRSPSRERWLSRDEAARLLRAAKRSQHLRRFILLGLYTGTRSGAILNLKWDQIDLQRGVLHRRASGVAEDARKRTPPVRLGKRILSHLRRWQRLDGGTVSYLCHYDGVRVQKLRRSFPQAAKRAGIVGVTPHTLRHTRATWLMHAGIDPWEAAGSLGMSVEMLQRTYGHHHPDFQKRAAEV
jgi:integrase